MFIASASLVACGRGSVDGTTGTFTGDLDVGGGGLFGVTTIVNGSKGTFLINNNANNANNMALTNAGDVTFRHTISGASGHATSPTFVPPVYAASGQAVSNTMHGAVGTCKATGGSCTAKLAGAAAFSGPDSYSCTADLMHAGSGTPQIINNSGSSVTFVVTGYAGTIAFNCLGV